MVNVPDENMITLSSYEKLLKKRVDNVYSLYMERVAKSKYGFLINNLLLLTLGLFRSLNDFCQLIQLLFLFFFMQWSILFRKLKYQILFQHLKST